MSVTQQDLNGDGKPDLTIIDCAFATDHDRIYVYDQGGDMRESTDWREATDFRNDVWLYDIGADNTVQLIVVYQIEDGHAAAYVYDDQDGDGQVAHQVNDRQVKILESPHWTARIISNSGWFLPDGRVNLNVRIQLDGPVPTFDRVPLVYTRDWMRHDGLIDAEFEEVADSAGIARYAVKRLLTDSPPDWGFERTGLQSNDGHYPSGMPERAFFPLLPIPVDRHEPRYVNLRYFDLPSAVAIDWLRGKVQAVGLDGYPIGHGYHFNDNRYVVKGQVNDVAFESPQAYYDLADNHDAFPEMHIRFFTHPPDDQTMWTYEGLSSVPWQSISYDWNLFNPGTLRWDFKVGLGGNYYITETMQFDDFAVNMVPFDQLPFWITNREWKLATFVAREGPGYESSEGIYEWQTDTGDDPEVGNNRADEARLASQGYTLGVTTTPPDAYFTSSRPGFRAERHFASATQPLLYFSPLDHKLHLRDAEAGVWNLDGGKMLRYANLNQDAYLDQWQYFENDRLRHQLTMAGPYLIYDGEDTVTLKRTEVAPALFETLPPRTHDEWAMMGQQLQAHQPNFAPEDFKAMLAQFDGPEWHIKVARLRDLRLDGTGFRFVLELMPGFQVTGSGGPNLSGKRPGAYVVTYHTAFSVEPLSPSAPVASIGDTLLTQLTVNAVPVRLRNDGLTDIDEATLELLATPPQESATLVVTQTVKLLAQAQVTATLLWTPREAGQWTLVPQIRQPDGRVITFKPTSVTVQPARAAAPATMVATSTSPEQLPFALAGLIAFAALAASILWRQLMKSPADHPDSEV